MANGWKLNEGSVSYEIISEDQLWSVIVKTLSNQSKKTTTYKFGLLRAILENLYKVNERLEINFEQISRSFAKLYWNLVIENGFSQGGNSSIEKELKAFQVKHQIPKGISFDSIFEAQRYEITKVVEAKVLNKYVLGALYEDTERLIYGFSKKQKIVVLTSGSWEFLVKYQTTIFKLTNYELAKFLEGKNTEINKNIALNAIENLTKRESLKKYQDILVNNSGCECFYTERSLASGVRSIAVDHFIPWSFIHSDELWNFVITSQSLNSKKGSKLPAERYLRKLNQRNQFLSSIEDVQVRAAMEKYRFTQVVKFYQYAELNGFETGWCP
ncbi:HNH endonuclease [Planococcus maritimus]|uniref:HNH endonuclease domain-containing protein n=1 Tax=Planococcus maritimus TaxID=192421 RepID=UPI00084CA6B2|nr:HNH endonuclease domain-containing protein [Planococcus maritimus]OED33583.1 HNH endonuclease [Planococcus maritimus]